MALVPRKGLERIRPAVHGGPDFTELRQSGISPDSLIDFSVGLNPLGPPPSLARKLATAPFDVYPDSQATDLRKALAQKLGLGPDNVIAGNGSSELIWLAALAYFSPGDPALIVDPTFGEYERACLIAGGQPVKIVAKPPRFTVMPGEIVASARQHRARGIFLCNPNNPTGVYMFRQEIEEVLSSLQDSLLLLDEAYVAFTDGVWPSESLVNKHDNILILRSMTKDYGLAGLRLGYALGSEGIISNLRRVCPPWNVNSIAQKAGIIVLAEEEYLRRGQETIRESRAFLFRELAKFGFEPLPSQTNFFLVKVGDAATLRRRLLRKGILARDCASFGLPEYLRLAALKLPDCERLVEALKEVAAS
ncbi:MAG: histidinol-phosphate aminotransferase family protein [Chloroflexi bacterium]|nr:histidinol-phosphate aminotransferase family protein [Chloroflexota bacterium]